MKLSLFIARRYLFSKKSHNAINVISAISVCGVALATLALVCTLSVFNGFQQMVADLFTNFDSDLEITATKGKVFNAETPSIQHLHEVEGVALMSYSLEEQVMLIYGSNQLMVTLKGVDDRFREITHIDEILYGNGFFCLHDRDREYAIPGIEVAARLGIGITQSDSLQVYAPKRGEEVNLADPTSAFVMRSVQAPGMVFAVNQRKYDSQYVLSSLNFARQLLGYRSEVSEIGVKVAEGANSNVVQRTLQSRLGKDYQVKNRYEQQEDVFRIMKLEKLISYIFLTFILLIACFNVVGSLSMLIIDKKKDVITLRHLGASDRLIGQIFLLEGRLISLFGALIGIVLGVGLCLLQQHFGFITLGAGAAEGAFVIDAYPVQVEVLDVFLVLGTVLLVGWIAVWYPVKLLTRKLIQSTDEKD